MRYDLIIEGGDVLLPGSDPRPCTLALQDGKVAAICRPGDAIDAAERLDASGLTIFPGVLDVHLHLGHGADISRPREPSDASQETAAAAAGGVTTIIPYLMSADPFEDIFDEVRAVTEAGARIDFGYHFIITTEAQLAAVPRYVSEFGAPSFKIFMNNRGGEGERLGLPDIDDGFLLRLCRLAAEHRGMVNPHPENIEAAWVLRREAIERDPEGAGGLASWNESRPPFIEADAVQRAGLFARTTGTPLYIVHVSSAEALEAGRAARRAGTDITLETCPHYLTHDVTWDGGTMGKINPPLREPADREALWQGILDGTIDTIGTDHVHRDASSKDGGIWKASPGCPNLETLLPVMLTEGHHARGIPLRRIVELLCANPARRMGLTGRKGTISVGADADLALVDLNASYTIDGSSSFSSAGYSIYEGWTMKGRVETTISRGEVVFRDGQPTEESVGRGRYLRRSFQ